MDKFYDLKGREAILPVGGSVLLDADATWATGIQTYAEKDATGLAEACMDIQGVSCVGCVWLIDAAFQQTPGAGRAIVDPTRGTATLSWFAGQFDLPAFVQRLAQFGYRLGPHTEGERTASASGLKLGLCGGLAMNAMAFTLPRYVGMGSDFALSNVFELVTAFSATLSLMTGGGYFIQRAWTAIKLRRLHLDVPIAIGIVAAWLGSVIGWYMQTPGLLYFDFVAVFIFLMLLGRRLQEVSVSKNRNRLLRADPTMQQVDVTEKGIAVAKSITLLEKDMEFSVRSGSVVPVSAELVAERATLSMEWITGEADPIVWSQGAILPAGAVYLGQQPVALRAREAWSESLLERLLKTQEGADDPAARWLDRTLRIYLSVILAAALLGGLIWLINGAAWPQALQVVVSVLVVSCPCALGVAVPMAHEIAVARLRNLGLFVKVPDLWGRLLRVKKLVFDKTGTLTLDTPQLLNPEQITTLSAEESTALSSLIRQSRHPISSALRETLANRGKLVESGPDSVEDIPGYGLKMVDSQNNLWELRRPESGDLADAMFTKNSISIAGFRFSEQMRGNAAAEVSSLRKLGMNVFLLSGDREEKVAKMAADLDLPPSQAMARHTPDQKGDWMKTNGADALFIGDGANDALAAQAALCSGTLAVERSLLAQHADFYFLSRSLRPLRMLFVIAKARRSAVLRAFSFAITYNLVVLIMALMGQMSPLLAAVLMPLSSIATLFIVSSTLRSAKDAPMVPDSNRSTPQCSTPTQPQDHSPATQNCLIASSAAMRMTDIPAPSAKLQGSPSGLPGTTTLAPASLAILSAGR